MVAVPQLVAARPAVNPTGPDDLTFRRIGAALVDLTLVATVVALAVAAAQGAGPSRLATGVGLLVVSFPLAVPSWAGPAGGSAGADLLTLLIILVVVLAWFVLGEARFGTTVGKRLAGLQVTDEAGARPGWGRASLRLLLRVSPVAWVGMVWASARRRPLWYDRLSATQVVRRSGEGGRRRLRLVEPSGPASGRGSVAGRAPLPQPEPTSAARSSPPARPAFLPRASARSRATLQRRRARWGRATPSGGPTPTRQVHPASADRRLRLVPPLPGGGEAPTSAGAEGATGFGPGAAGEGALEGGPGARCRCDELPRLSGADAVRYARGHLMAVRRWPGAGRFALVCPATRVAWMAHDDWADHSGEATLVRLAALPDPVRVRRQPERP